MDDSDRAEIRALCDQFRQLMARQVEVPLFDNEARVRIGEMSGSAVRDGGSEFGYLRRRARTGVL
jgi:hypothetical protein